MSKLVIVLALIACWLNLASAASAQTYTGEAVFPDYVETLTFFPFDPDIGEQIEVTCTWQRSLGWKNVSVTLSPSAFSFDVESSSLVLSGTDERFCVDGSNAFPFELRTVVVSATGVSGQNSTGSVTASLLFGSNGETLSGPVTYSNRGGMATLTAIGPQELLSELVEKVLALNVQAGIGNALDSKLQNALDALDRAQTGDTASAAGILYAFIQSVEAQRGKTLSDAEADDLTESAEVIIGALTQP